jgi:hypothetical protein
MDISQILEKNRNKLMHIDGVVGVGIGKEKNNEVIVVIVLSEMKNKVIEKIPKKLGEYKVKIKQTGEIKAR